MRGTVGLRQELERLEDVDYETNRPAGPIKVILLEDVEGVLCATENCLTVNGRSLLFKKTEQTRQFHVAGIGHQFDVVEVDRKRARTDLLLARRAVYASPFDLQYYAKMKEVSASRAEIKCTVSEQRMADELAARVRIPYELLVVGRELQKLVVPLR